MQASLVDVPELPNLGKGAGMHIRAVREAVALKERLELEKRVTELLQSAVAERDLASLQNAVKMADDMVFSIPLVAQAKALIERLLEEKRVLAELKKSIEVSCVWLLAARSFTGVNTASTRYVVPGR